MIYKKNYLIYLLIFLSIVIAIFNFSEFIIERSTNQYSDWLINYQGGFVRRGLIGELIFKLYQITKINLNLILFWFVAFFYLSFCYFFTKLIKKLELNHLNLLILFSPLSFIYPVMEQKVSGRKDIMFLAAISFCAVFLSKIKLENQKFILIFIITLLVFSHSAFYFYLPFIFLLFYIINYKANSKNFLKELLIILIFSFFLFLLTTFNTKIDNIGIDKICLSIKDFYSNCGQNDYIATLSWSLKYEIYLVETIWNKENYIIFYLLAGIFAFIPIIITFLNTKVLSNKFKNINMIIVFILLNLITFPVYYIGADYGRYMHISYISFAVIYFKSLEIKFLKQKKINFKFSNLLIILIIVIYGFAWTIPHCCNNQIKYTLEKPYKELKKFVLNNLN